MKITSENKVRANLKKMAHQYGCSQELEELFSKYDRMLQNCSNQKDLDPSLYN